MSNVLYIAADHAGYVLKQAIIEYCRKNHLQVIDLGTDSAASCDYPDYAHELCRRVLADEAKGILICGTGIGMSIAANRHPGIRAALCCHEFHARAAREHNNANVLCLGERITAPGLATEMVRLFLETPFAGGRHERRVGKMEIENSPAIDRGDR